MKKTIALAVLLCSLVANNCYAAQSMTVPEKQDHYRYQLFQGKYETIIAKGNSGGIKQESLFRIDTETGKTWVFLEVVQDEKLRRVWIPIEDKVSQ